MGYHEIDLNAFSSSLLVLIKRYADRQLLSVQILSYLRPDLYTPLARSTLYTHVAE